MGSICMDLITLGWICIGCAKAPMLVTQGNEPTRGGNMNGICDVRLALRGQELEAGQRRVRLAPARERWDLFWLRRHTRKALLALTCEQLRDIGLTEEQAREEGLKPFWRG